MKERQRWQPEEDALLKAYVKQYGPKEWNLISQRMNKSLHRDAKSCLERWKNYLKPGIKKGSLTLEEQNLVISLQSKYGNKWKKIASQVPGRTAKRLGKWWEVFKEKQLKLRNQQSKRILLSNSAVAAAAAAVTTATSTSTSNTELEEVLQNQGKYDHILETFAEKYVQPKLRSQHQQSSLLPSSSTASSCSLLMPNLSFSDSVPHNIASTTTNNNPVLSLGCSISASTDLASSSVLPPWMSTPNMGTSSMSSSSSTTPSPSVSLTLSPSEPPLSQPQGLQAQAQQTTVLDSVTPLFLSVHQMGTLVQYCRELEEGRQNWVQHKKEATWRLNRLEQQLDSEKARKKREIMEELEAKIRCLREEELGYFERIESECREQVNAMQRDAETQEAKMVEIWCSKQAKLAKLVEQRGSFHHHHHHHHQF